MNKRTFRLLIISKWLLIILGMILYVSTKRLLPPELKAYFETQSNMPLTNIETAFLWLFLVFLILMVINSIGLFKFKNWARKVFIFLLVADVLFTITGTPYVMTGWTMAISYLSAMLDGMILTLIYFSSIRELFEQ